MDSSDIRETIGELRATVKAAHFRVDKVEVQIAAQLTLIQTQLIELNAHMNKGKGWAAASMFISGIVGAGVVKLVSTFYK
jgi:predicted ATPase